MTESNERLNAEDEGTQVVVIDAVTSLINAFGTGQQEAIQDALHQLGVHPDDNLYKQVGHMARSLHDALTEFKSSLAQSNLTMSTTNIPDASDKLEAVISMTQQAAEKTMNLADEQLLKLSQVRKENTSILQNLDTLSPEELKNVVRDHIHKQDEKLAQIEVSGTEIIMTQEFQDLTGQSLKKVMKLVNNLEGQLVSLVKLFGFREGDTTQLQNSGGSTASGNGSQLGQDETDALLSSLGF